MKVCEVLKDVASTYGIDLSQHELELFQLYSDLILAGNQVTNLTAITDDLGMAVKHFLDSLMLTKAASFSKNMKVMDLGTGAGLPGIPLKIHIPSIKLTLVDSIKKRQDFWKRLALN